MNSLSTWVIAGTAQNATHLIMVMDHFDYDTYPVYVLPTDNVLDVINKYRFKSMQRIVDVYELSDSKAVKVTKSYSVAPASPQEIAVKEDRKRSWEELARISEQVVINESTYVQIPSLLFRWAIFGEEK